MDKVWCEQAKLIQFQNTNVANLFTDLVLQDICARLLLLPGILDRRDSVSAFNKLEVCWHSRFLERKRQG